MGKLEDNAMFKVESMYLKKNIPLTKWDRWLWRVVIYGVPKMVIIPLMFWLLKFIFIDMIYNNKGFEKTIIYVAIFFMIQPMITEILKGVVKEI